MHFDVCETVTEQTYGRDVEQVLDEVRGEAEQRTKKMTGYILNVIQVQGHGFTYKGDLFLAIPNVQDKFGASLFKYLNLTDWFMQYSEINRSVTLFIVDVPRVELNDEQIAQIKD